VLIRSGQSASSCALLAAEDARLRAAGWRHATVPPPIDYDVVGNATAPLADSWFAPGHKACAYVATDHAAVTAEGKELIPFDSHDDPHGMLAFYDTAKAAASHEALWVRLHRRKWSRLVPAKPLQRLSWIVPASGARTKAGMSDRDRPRGSESHNHS
jgi:hypothetical protein